MGSFLGGLGQLMGGNSKSSGSSDSTSNSTSQNQSQNSNVQASQSNSNQSSSNASGSANQAYGSLAKALDPSLGYVTSAGSMIGALLGLPTNNTDYNVPAPSVLPTMPHSSGGSGSGSGTPRNSMVDALYQAYLKGSLAPHTPAPTGTPTPTTPPGTVPPPTGTPVPVPGTPLPGFTGGGGAGPMRREGVNFRALGGPVQAGQPYVVGEHQAEVFVPHTNGTILPDASRVGLGGRLNLADLAGRFNHHGRNGRTPPIMYQGPEPVTPPGSVPPVQPPATTSPTPYPVVNPTNALNNWADSAGQQFVLNEGQKAISGASASNGTFDSGATGKALVQYGQNLGNTYLNDYMNHLFDYAKLGLGSATALGGAGNVSQSVGSSTGGTNSSSFGYGQGTASGSSNSTSNTSSETKSKSKQGLGI